MSLKREFAQRAVLYRQWDRALCESTRFYEAAALINAVFAESLTAPVGWLLSGRTVDFFIVQRHLAELHRRERRAYVRLVREANGWLALVQTSARLSAAFPNTTVLGAVLRQLHGVRGTWITFASWSDREAVGNALIVAARRTAAGRQGRVGL